MKICILIHDLIPYSTKASAKMIYDLAHEASNNGHQVSIILPSPKIGQKIEIIKDGNITIYRFQCGSFENENNIKRAINETLLSFYAWFRLKEFFISNPHDYIIYYSPTIFWGRLVSKLKKIWKIKSYLILRDFFPQWVIDNGMLSKNSIITKYFLFFEKLNYAAADNIGIQSPKNLEWFLENKYSNAKLEVLYNWTQVNIFDLKSEISFRKKYNILDKIMIVYGGNMGPAQDMRNVMELAKNLKKHKEFHLVLAGSGYEVDLVLNYIQESDLSNVTYLKSIPPEDYAILLSEADIGLFALNKLHKTHNFPGKVLGYLSQGIPILGIVNPENDLMKLINESNSGLISIAEDHETFYKNALKLKKQSDRSEMGKNAKKLLYSKFTVKSALESILKHAN
ncbi:glycosyltransferase family 4 protein [Leptospira sp. GIMC2001]|uniref:glycosyltransferase family 4 protein n=1 Tax=Leptospira sp. GIMC2001 TaxID=1513297 RepID=UPI0023491FA2|nr:glycosyltransferase family 4 protein [Leptospira sp. GIMC2001]WCL51253.1 glycosyltransferase family 4 protein [Leptospira sp. GIMC2001]